jgi:hypothetical protein
MLGNLKANYLQRVDCSARSQRHWLVHPDPRTRRGCAIAARSTSVSSAPRGDRGPRAIWSRADDPRRRHPGTIVKLNWMP